MGIRSAFQALLGDDINEDLTNQEQPNNPTGAVGIVNLGSIPQAYTAPLKNPMIDQGLLESVTQPQSSFSSIDDLIRSPTNTIPTPQQRVDTMQYPKLHESAFSHGSIVDGVLAGLRKREGNYDTLGDIGDGAGISVGAYQFTEKSGQAQELAKRLGLKSVNKLTPKLLASPIGRKAQDNLAVHQYVNPARKAAKRNKVTDSKAIEFLIDTNLNGGMQNVINRAKKKGGLTLANLKAARKDRYAALVKENPKKYKQFIKGWNDRVDRF